MTTENFLSLSSIRVVDFILPLIILPYIISIIGVEKFGLVSFASSLAIYFLNISQYGFSLSAVRELAKFQNNHDKIQQLYSTTICTKFFLLLISLIVYLLLISLVESFSDYWLLYLFSFGVVIGDVLFPKWFFQGMENMRYITFINIFFKLSYLLLILIFLRNQEDYYLIPFFQSIGMISGGIYSLFLIKKKFNISIVFPGFKRIFQTLKDSFSSFLTLIMPTFYSNTSIFVMGLLTNNTLVGYFSGGVKISNAFSSVNVILTRTFYPYVNKTKNDINIVNQLIFFTALLTSLIMFFTADYTVYYLLGFDMEKSVLIVKILSLTPILLSIRTIFGINYLLVRKLDSLYMKISFVSSIIGLILCFIIIPNFSHYGGALVIVIAQLIYALLSYYFAKFYKYEK